MIVQRVNKCIFIIFGSIYVLILLYSLLGATFHFQSWLTFLTDLSIGKELKEFTYFLNNMDFSWDISFSGNIFSDIVEVAKAIGNTLSNIGMLLINSFKLLFMAPIKDLITIIGLILGAF